MALQQKKNSFLASSRASYLKLETYKTNSKAKWKK